MGQGNIVIEKTGGIGFLILNQPETGNRLSDEMFNGISPKDTE